MGRKKKQKQQKRRSALLDELLAADEEVALLPEDQAIVEDYEAAIEQAEVAAAKAAAEELLAAKALEADAASFVEELEGEPGESGAFLAAMAALESLSPEALRAAKGVVRASETPSKRGSKKRKVRRPGKGGSTEVLGPLGQMNFVHASVPRKVVRQLRRGAVPWADDLDLHGLTWREAKSEVATFLRGDANDRGEDYTCYLIIHGKGHGAVLGTATLKSRLYTYLQQQPHVLAAISALPKDGGLGAAYVLVAQ